MKINPYIFRGYDLRGIVDKDLNPEIVEAIGKAYGTYLRRRKIRQAVIGRDCRLSGEEFSAAIKKGLNAEGVNVIDIGMVMTQMVYFAQYLFQANGCVVITASHNPYNYNGFKLGRGYSKTTEQEEIQEIKKTVENDLYFVSQEKGNTENRDVTESYIADILKKIKLKKKFKVVIDSRHGVTGIYIPEVLRRAGCEVIVKNQEPDGNFPAGTPDPTGEKIMKELAEAVLQEKADIGFSFDGDGDRIGTVDSKGKILWNDVLVAIFSREMLERFPGSKIVYNNLCSQVVREVIRQSGGIPVMWRTGHGFIRSKIAAENAPFGGELSGHFFFADNAYGYDDGCFAAMRLLEYLSEKNLTLSELYDTFPVYISSPEIKIGCPDDKKEGVIKDLSEKFKADFPGAQITDDTIIPGDDGIRADFSDGMMIFRYSQNGPYITIKFEAKDQERYEERRKYIREMLKKYPEMIWEDELSVNLEVLDF